MDNILNNSVLLNTKCTNSRSEVFEESVLMVTVVYSFYASLHLSEHITQLKELEIYGHALRSVGIIAFVGKKAQKVVDVSSNNGIHCWRFIAFELSGFSN